MESESGGKTGFLDPFGSDKAKTTFSSQPNSLLSVALNFARLELKSFFSAVAVCGKG